MVVPVKFSLSFSSYINLQISVEGIADKMQNLLTKQEREGAYMNYQKNFSLKLPCNWGKSENHLSQINKFHDMSVYTKLNVSEDLKFVIHAFSSH